MALFPKRTFVTQDDIMKAKKIIDREPVELPDGNVRPMTPSDIMTALRSEGTKLAYIAGLANNGVTLDLLGKVGAEGLQAVRYDKAGSKLLDEKNNPVPDHTTRHLFWKSIKEDVGIALQPLTENTIPGETIHNWEELSTDDIKAIIDRESEKTNSY